MCVAYVSMKGYLRWADRISASELARVARGGASRFFEIAEVFEDVCLNTVRSPRAL